MVSEASGHFERILVSVLQVSERGKGMGAANNIAPLLPRVTGKLVRLTRPKLKQMPRSFTT